MSNVPKATHEGEIDLGFGPIACANLDNGLRIVSQSCFLQLLGRDSRASGKQQKEFDKQPPFLTAKNLQAFIDEDLRNSTNPVLYKPLSGGRGGQASGYPAELLPAVCKVYWRAKRADVLRKNQMHVAIRCEDILVALASVGIAALVDEATGYQEIRPKETLQSMLKVYLQANPNPWSRQFRDEFYAQIYRLKGWSYTPYQSKRCPLVGRITVDIVYKRLQPQVWEELQKINLDKKKLRYHQFLTKNIGNPHLREHLTFLTDTMKMFPNWDLFIAALNRSRPICNEDIQMDIFLDLLLQSPEDLDRWKKMVS